MKPFSQTIIFMLAIFTAMASAHAQTPREQLNQMVEQLQKTPTDNALREKIIKLAQTVKPAPAVPDEAQRREGRAKFAFKSAKSNDDYLSAAREYEEAVRVAPWIPGYYSDLCTIYEKAEKYAEAKRNCEFSLIGLTDPAQVNEIKQRIAGLEFGIEKAEKAANDARENSPEAKARKDEELIRRLDGALFVDAGGHGFEDQILIIGKQLKLQNKRLRSNVCDCGGCSGSVGEVVFCDAAVLEGRAAVMGRHGKFNGSRYIIAPDGNSVMEVWLKKDGTESSTTFVYKRR